MSIMVWLIFGILAGWIASLFIDEANELSIDIIVGIIGAFLGGWAMNFLGKGGFDSFSTASILTTLLGSVMLMVTARTFLDVNN